MARRKRRWHPVGKWLRAARQGSELTLKELERLTGISSSALARFESDEATPNVGDVCLIAQQLGWPLLYLTSGRERTGDDTLALASQLYYWGLRDIALPERVLLGEVRPFENLVAVAVAGELSPRILEAIPGLLLRNRLDASELISCGRQFESLRRLGWLADVAQTISKSIPREHIRPEASRWFRTVIRSAQDEATPKEVDHVFTKGVSAASAKQALAQSPPLTKRWRIACDIPLSEFQERAVSILERPKRR